MRVRLGTPVFAGVVQQQNAAVPRLRRRCDSVHPLHFGGVAHQQSARLTCERQRGQHSPLPPFSRGHSSVSQSGCSTCVRSKARIQPHHFCPCGVVQSTRLPLMQEVTGAKPVRDANPHAPKALSTMHSLGKRISSVQLRVGAPFLVTVRKFRSRASAQAGFISPLCPGQHWRLRPFSPPCSSLRISFVKNSCRGSTGWRLPLCGTAPAARVAQCRGTTSRASPVQVQVLPRAPVLACKH